MNNLSGVVWQLVSSGPGLVDNASVPTAEINVEGCSFCTILVAIGDTDIAMTALKVQESDTSGSGFTDITGLRYGTDNGIDGTASALPSATDDNKLFLFTIDCRGGRKKFLDVVATCGNGTLGTNIMILAAKDYQISPTTAAEMGAANLLRA